MNKRIGEVRSVHGNMVTASFAEDIIQNEVGYVIKGKERLMAEVIRIFKDLAYMQVFEDTKGIRVGDKIEFSKKMLSVQLGPGLLGQVYDGLQNPLAEIAQEFGFFLPRGIQLSAVDQDKKWRFHPLEVKGKKVTKGTPLGYVQEGIFKHLIMVPFYLDQTYEVLEIAKASDYKTSDTVASIKNEKGEVFRISMIFEWPIKIPITAYEEKLIPQEPLITKARIIDTLFPVSRGGTYCIPGPFGAGKTVLQQLTSRYADVDIVVIAACGERAGEVVETLRKFPELKDPRTGKFLIERTIIICNTSSMPVAARDASVYTGATIGEYYRQMGLNVLLLADSTSRWAQAMREVSGRLEEIPGEEAYPAYLESRIAEFYERSGTVRLPNNTQGSLTIGGTVSPAGGNFDEPVTQSTLKVVGAFHGLSRDRANARCFPSIDPLESWSRYKGLIDVELVTKAKKVLREGNEVDQMMKVVGEEGTSMDDFILYLKAEFLDGVYLQQNGFDEVDAATGPDRQQYVFKKVVDVLAKEFNFDKKETARKHFYKLRQLFIDWNYKAWESQEFKSQQEQIDKFLDSSKEDKNEEDPQ